ncbi:MAG: DUF1800 domain-containing protein [Chloroflexota bacterium]
MSVSRRRFLGTSAAVTAAGAAVVTVTHPKSSTAQVGGAAPQIQIAATPSPAIIALNRMGYGPRPGDIQRVKDMGLQAYIDEQLDPDTINDGACQSRIQDARLRISYDSGEGYAGKDEIRKLTNLDKDITDIWYLTDWEKKIGYAERVRPFDETRVATWIRAIYSKRQLKEVMVEFWHNHFNIDGSSDAPIAVAFPTYNRIMRRHCFGNFRAFLEDVAKSTAMMYYLDNRSNRAGEGEGGNENYARELLELHTFGAENYLGFVDNPANVGTITYNGKKYVKGYIENDIFEIANCLSGWTVADGYWQLPDEVADNGEFYYYDEWHATGAKTVFSLDGEPTIPADQPALKDGQDVLDMVAAHPHTARTICTKLCRRFIADNPPESVVDAAVDVWMNNLNSDDQIKKVMRTILLSEAFKTTWGEKIKRPFEAIVSYLRATEAEMENDHPEKEDPDHGNNWGSIMWRMRQTGHKIFEWAPPTGFPDTAGYWMSTNGLLQRWNIPHVIAQSWGGDAQIDLIGATDMQSSCTDIVDFWINRLCGYEIDASRREELIAFMAQEGNPTQAPQPNDGAPDWKDPKALEDRLKSMVQLLAMYPEFHMR